MSTWAACVRALRAGRRFVCLCEWGVVRVCVRCARLWICVCQCASCTRPWLVHIPGSLNLCASLVSGVSARCVRVCLCVSLLLY